MALQTPPSGLSSTQIQFQGQKQTDKQVSQTGHCRSARKVFAVGRLEKIFLKIISRYIKELRATQTHFFLFFLSLLSFREGNLAERNRHVAVCNYIFFFFFCLHRQKCRAGRTARCRQLQRKLWQGEKMFYVGAHFLKSAIPDHSHAFHLFRSCLLKANASRSC